ncbi:uncharacterized protein LOC135215904 [Macrobrachium nipponense]|uniref:uncharacterized protein LOC135215904 n=1 Tax=Macrobrachium nipponense TaxID=159736 RepID=UPI0030C85E56
METLKVVQLREGLRARSLPMGGNKSALYQRLSESLEKEGRSVQEFLKELEVRQNSEINQDQEAGEDIGPIPEEEEHLNVGDSASVMGRQSVASGGSKQSSVSSTGSRRVLAAASRARLEAKLQKLEELQAIEREEEALRQRREKLRLEAEIAEVVAEEKVLQQFDENNREIAPVTRIREHINPDMDRSEQPMGLGAVVPEVSSGRNNQGDLSNKEILQTLISCSLKGLMPKQDMAKFDGDYTKYFRFIRSFDDIFSSQLTNDKERLRYLDLYTTGRPNEIVAACLHLDASEGYRQARKLLEERYGNLEQIATAYVDKVIEWKDMGENNAEDFDEYAVMLKTCRNAISCVPYGVAELQNPKNNEVDPEQIPI